MSRRSNPPTRRRRPGNGASAPAIRLGLRLAAYHRVRFGATVLVWLGWTAMPVALGLLLQRAFDAIAADAPVASVAGILAALAAVEASRLGLFGLLFVLWPRWWAAAHALLRTNLLHGQLSSGGQAAARPLTDTGAALAVFRDDAKDLVEFVDGWIDLAGALTFACVAIAVMARIDPVLTLVVFVPMVGVFAVTRLLADRLRRFRLADREATARVTGFLGDVFAAALAVKVAGAEDRTVDRLRALNGVRRRATVRDRVLTNVLEAVNHSMVDVSIGLVLLLVAGSMRAGTFTVGDLALFASYLAWLSWLTQWAATVFTRHRHAQVATARMAAAAPAADPRAVVVHRPLHLRLPVPATTRPRLPAPAAAAVRLEGFTVGASGALVHGVDLDLPAGSFTVVCGAVGSGKTTLLRGLLGLAPSSGSVRWNGAVVDDLAGHMVPPRAAYVPQVPRLFSASLRDNLALGGAGEDRAIAAALRAAALDLDVAAMPDGLDTVLGPRGVRLSGGQLQRAATARALVARAALLVLDDLSSALDAATEQDLWSRLLGGHAGGGARPTVLVVSHRAGALALADQVVVLEQGRVLATGTWAELRARGLDPLRAAQMHRVGQRRAVRPALRR